MGRRKCLKLFAIMAFVFVLLPALCGCQNGKKFDSSESMISEMAGTYSGSNEHSGERIVIDGNSVITFNIDDIFPEITDEVFFLENFPNENWEEFDIDALLGKPYVEITTEPISANIKKSTISGLWIDKNGVLFSQEDYPLNKTSSESIYPTAEMQEKFEEYHKYLQEYEISSITAEAENNLSNTKKSLESTLSSATSSDSGSHKSTASAETIAECAFESLKDHIKYPRTAKLESFSTSPQYDSYGRVATLITVTTQNGFGNYITEDVYVVLQSCSSSGSYTYTPGGMHYSKNENYLSSLLFVNDWDQDPSTDSAKEVPYNEAIQLIKNKQYELAVKKLETLGDYKSSIKLKEACISFSVAEKYKNAIDLFDKGKYAEAREKLSSLLKDYSSGYLRVERVSMLCDMAINNTSGNNGNTSGGENTSQPSATQPPATQPPATQPPATQPPAVCAHNFANATCTAPKTCTKCGATTGSAAGHSWKDASCTAPKTCTLCGATTGTALRHSYSVATCTTPKTCSVCGITSGTALGHSWNNITETVYHEEQGHYEDVEVAKKVQKVQCFVCSNRSDSLEEYYSHFDSTHSEKLNADALRELYELKNDWVYEYETKWIVDKKAYTETVVIGRNCRVCGEEE